MSLADRIRTVLAEMDGPEYGKQARLAKIAGCGRPAVNNWLSHGQKKINSGHALAICAALGYRAEWLVAGKGPKKEPGSELVAKAELKPVQGPKDADTGESLQMVHVTLKELEMLSTYRGAPTIDRMLIERVCSIVEKVLHHE